MSSSRSRVGYDEEHKPLRTRRIDYHDIYLSREQLQKLLEIEDQNYTYDTDKVTIRINRVEDAYYDRLRKGLSDPEPSIEMTKVLGRCNHYEHDYYCMCAECSASVLSPWHKKSESA